MTSYCWATENILMLRNDRMEYKVSPRQQVTIRCLSKSPSVGIYRGEMAANDRDAAIVFNSKLLTKYGELYIFNSFTNGSLYVSDLNIRKVTPKFNYTLFWCVDMIYRNIQELTLSVFESPSAEYPKCLSSYGSLTFFNDQIGEVFRINCISEEGNLPGINLSLQNSLVSINRSSVSHGRNETHNYIEFDFVLDSKWNKSIFICYLTQSQLSFADQCSFEPIAFVSEFLIYFSASNVTAKEKIPVFQVFMSM